MAETKKDALAAFDVFVETWGVKYDLLPTEGRDHHPSLHARLFTNRHSVASRRKVRAQDEFALETARLETAVCLGDLIEGNPLSDARPDGADCQQAEEPL